MQLFSSRFGAGGICQLSAEQLSNMCSPFLKLILLGCVVYLFCPCACLYLTLFVTALFAASESFCVTSFIALVLLLCITSFFAFTFLYVSMDSQGLLFCLFSPFRFFHLSYSELGVTVSWYCVGNYSSCVI